MFISLDGIDGAGKSTQIDMLKQFLETGGARVACFRDPGSTKLGEAIREILLHREDIPLAMTSEMLLYMAARAQLVADQIRPSLAEGMTVICDRFLLSNVVYQGVAGGLDVDELWAVGRSATGGLFPDVTIVLDISPELAANRIQRGHDRLEKRGIDYYRKVRHGFLEQVAKASARSFVVDASRSADVVHAEILSLIAPA
ncbi:MAG: dTMP kinase [Pirellula sp.]